MAGGEVIKICGKIKGEKKWRVSPPGSKRWHERDNQPRENKIQRFVSSTGNSSQQLLAGYNPCSLCERRRSWWAQFPSYSLMRRLWRYLQKAWPCIGKCCLSLLRQYPWLALTYSTLFWSRDFFFFFFGCSLVSTKPTSVTVTIAATTVQLITTGT